jgi:hypothetical protein
MENEAMTAVVPIELTQGEDFATQIVWTGVDDAPNNVIHPCRMDVKDAAGTTIISLATLASYPEGEIPEMITSPDIGMIQIYISATATAAMPHGVYGYDLFCTVDDEDAYAGNQINRLMAGQFTVNKRITVMT